MKLVVLLERQWIPAAHVCFVEVENADMGKNSISTTYSWLRWCSSYS